MQKDNPFHSVKYQFMTTPRNQIIDFIAQDRLPKENVQQALI